MAQRAYTAVASGVAFAGSKAMLGIFNGAGSGQVLRVYRVWLQNSQTSVSVIGGYNIMTLHRTTAGSAGTAVTPTKHDSTAGALHANVIVSHNQTVTTSSSFRRFLWSTDENASYTTISSDSFESFPSLSCVFDSGHFNETAVTPIVLREGFGIAVYCTTATFTVGALDSFIEFTMDTV